MDSWNGVFTLITVLATIVNVYFVYRGYELTRGSEASKKPMIDIKLESLPPYKSDTQKTILKLKNVGSRDTKTSPLVIVSCSWMPSVSYKLNFPSDNYTLAVNEEIVWKFRMDEHFTPNSIVAVKVFDKSTSWELHEQI